MFKTLNVITTAGKAGKNQSLLRWICGLEIGHALKEFLSQMVLFPSNAQSGTE